MLLYIDSLKSIISGVPAKWTKVHLAEPLTQTGFVELVTARQLEYDRLLIILHQANGAVILSIVLFSGRCRLHLELNFLQFVQVYSFLLLLALFSVGLFYHVQVEHVLLECRLIQVVHILVDSFITAIAFALSLLESRWVDISFHSWQSFVVCISEF